ncbi:reverse transcriptase domain-containing protein [Tanacetum coccineum]|uniref:Reverse transcriptase domain-containing protein n=1 Tax=Tanacetum coccineum TaxID=301880 RepID=A0ABQ4Y983_9ASTR
MCDASDYAVEAVLGQRIDKHFKPIHYTSKTMNEAYENYTTTKKELLAVVFAFDKFRQYLVLSKTIIRDKKGAENIATDHLSRLKNPDLGKLTRAEIRDLFLEERLMEISDKNNEPCVLTESYESAWTEMKLHKFFNNVTADHPEDIMALPPSQGKSSRPGIDFVGPFPSSNGNKYILVAIDYVSKWVKAQAFPTSDARNVVNFLRRLFARFGIPKALISDRGSHFCNYQMEKAIKRIMTSKAQQIEPDNALVAPENRHVIGKCNMRMNPGMKPKEPTYQLALDVLTLTTCYPAFLITSEVPVIYMHQFWATVTKHKSSYRFKIDNKKFSVNVELFRDILNICPRIQDQEFNEPPTEKEALSFIRELGHSGEIKYIIDVIVDHLHQLWRTFASIINKCLCGKIDNIDSKKQDKMFYARFTKIIIHHFLEKDKSISMRNKMFMYTTRDDSLLGAEPLISMKNQKKSDSAISSKESSSKKKSVKAKKVAASKPKLTKKKSLIKADRGKGATKQSKKDFHISKASGSGDGTDFESGVPDEQHLKTTGVDDGTEEDEDDENNSKDISDDGDDDDDGNDVNDGDDDDANNDDNQEALNTMKKKKMMDDEEDDEVTKELYKDVNVNLGNEDIEMTNADQGGSEQQHVSQESGFEQVEEDAHVTLSPVLDT